MALFTVFKFRTTLYVQLLVGLWCVCSAVLRAKSVCETWRSLRARSPGSAARAHCELVSKLNVAEIVVFTVPSTCQHRLVYTAR